MRLPVENGVITSDYGMRVLFGKEQFHDGIDFISRENNTVYSIAPGVVVHDMDDYDHAQRWNDRRHSAGNYLIIKHGNIYCRYLHLGVNAASKNEQIQEGQAIGKYGDYGFSFGPHLHIDMYDINWQRINPYSLEEFRILLESLKVRSAA